MWNHVGIRVNFTGTFALLLNLIHAINEPTYWPYDILETIKAGSLYDRLPNWSNKE